MLADLARTLKKMTGFRLPFSMRINKRNALTFLFMMLFCGIFYAAFYIMWWSIIGCGWVIYGICYLYYFIFRSIYRGLRRLFKGREES